MEFVNVANTWNIEYEINFLNLPISQESRTWVENVAG
jgi:hypothetical protein